MKREILFRGKRKDTGEWVEGQYIDEYIVNYVDLATSWEPGTSDHKLTVRAFEVIPETVGRLLGLKDAYGQRIFDGDILDFDPTEWGGKFQPEAITEADVLGEWRLCGSLGDLTEWRKVIGNIHDNPELVNQPSGANQ